MVTEEFLTEVEDGTKIHHEKVEQQKQKKTEKKKQWQIAGIELVPINQIEAEVTCWLFGSCDYWNYLLSWQLSPTTTMNCSRFDSSPSMSI